MGAATEMMRKMLANGPLALGLSSKPWIAGSRCRSRKAALEANSFGLLAATDDMREGMRAFLEKRPPRFSGR